MKIRPSNKSYLKGMFNRSIIVKGRKIRKEARHNIKSLEMSGLSRKKLFKGFK